MYQWAWREFLLKVMQPAREAGARARVIFHSLPVWGARNAPTPILAGRSERWMRPCRRTGAECL